MHSDSHLPGCIACILSLEKPSCTGPAERRRHLLKPASISAALFRELNPAPSSASGFSAACSAYEESFFTGSPRRLDTLLQHLDRLCNPRRPRLFLLRLADPTAVFLAMRVAKPLKSRKHAFLL